MAVTHPSTESYRDPEVSVPLHLRISGGRTKGAYLRSLYAPDDEAVARVVQKR